MMKLLSLTGALAGIVAVASVASAQTVPAPATSVVAQLAPAPMATRGPGRSDRNLRHVRRGLERLIDQLQNDQHDYDGHRAAALNDLKAARAELEQALRTDGAH